MSYGSSHHCWSAGEAGRIIVTSSTQGQHDTKFGAAYSASKWGIIGLMKSAALELAAHNITVNAVIPGLINTALTRHGDRYAQVIAEAGGTPSGDVAQDERTAIELLKKKTPLGVPWLEPEDVAPMVAFLALTGCRRQSDPVQEPADGSQGAGARNGDRRSVPAYQARRRSSTLPAINGLVLQAEDTAPRTAVVGQGGVHLQHI
jgi:hypothetical protein